MTPYYSRDNITIFCGEASEVLSQFEPGSIDLTVTSPPYDAVTEDDNGNLITHPGGLRTYNGYTWDFATISAQLYRITKVGGVVVWVVGDATVNGSETGTSFRQALGFMGLGFKLHDTMIYQKSGVLGGAGNPASRYSQDIEYMFVLAKGKMKIIPNLIRVGANNAGKKKTGTTRRNRYNDDGGLDAKKKINSAGKFTNEEKIKSNVWVFNVGYNHSTADKQAFEQPALFPEALARDHIISWSNPGDVVCDCFLGSGTTAKMAQQLGRRFVGCEISESYCQIAVDRLRQPSFFSLPQMQPRPEIKQEVMDL